MERTLGHEDGRELRPAERLSGRELLRAIDRRRNEDAAFRGFALGLPPSRPWWLDPRYG